MSENSATRVLEDGQNRAFGDGRIRASDLRPLLATMTAARDGDFAKVPETGYGPVAELSPAFDQIIDRGLHFDTEVRRARRELVRHGRLDERPSASPGQGSWVVRPGGRAKAQGTPRSWRAVTETVDTTASRLTTGS
ncbi:hypothetical protein ABZ460_28630 [Streptomyces fagopyri]